MTRDNKPQGFFYLDRHTVDGMHGIILDIYITAGNINHSQSYVKRLDYTLKPFNLNPIAVGLTRVKLSERERVYSVISDHPE